MKILAVLGAVGACFVMLSGAAYAQAAAPTTDLAALQGKTLWTNLTFGMTTAEVLTAQPEATVLKKPKKSEDGSTCELRLKEYRVQVTIYQVCFYFKEGRLLHVDLVREAGNTALFNDVSEQIKRKYGPEQEGQISNPYLKMRRWHNATNTITLMYKVPIGLGLDIGDITWIYGPPMPSEADKL